MKTNSLSSIITSGNVPMDSISNWLILYDVCQIPALIPSTRLIFFGEVPESYQWADNIRLRLGKEGIIKMQE